MTKGVDLSGLTEDERIDHMGKTLMDAPKRSDMMPMKIAVIVEDQAKAERYIAKFKAKFPEVRFIDRHPFQGAVLIRFGEPLR